MLLNHQHLIQKNGAVKYYENIGTSDEANFEEKPLKNPLKNIEVGSNSAPIFVDNDQDRDRDVFIGSGDGTVKYYENKGSAKKAIFKNRTAQKNPLNNVKVERDSTPALADIDNDGILEVFIGSQDGTVKYYKKTEKVINQSFVKGKNLFVDLPRADSTVTIVDIDGDEDLDAFIGARDGKVRYYKNTGSPKSPRFEKRNRQNNPLNQVDIGWDSYPTFVDIDNDKDLDSFIGAGNGRVMFCENTGTVNQPLFEKCPEPSNIH